MVNVRFIRLPGLSKNSVPNVLTSVRLIIWNLNSSCLRERRHLHTLIKSSEMTTIFLSYLFYVLNYRTQVFIILSLCTQQNLVLQQNVP